MPAEIDRDAIAQLCKQYGVRRLAVFGSAQREDFDPEHSDVDFLVEFLPDRTEFTSYFDLKDALERLMRRPVDLVSPSALDNRYFAASVREDEQLLYPPP